MGRILTTYWLTYALDALDPYGTDTRHRTGRSAGPYGECQRIPNKRKKDAAAKERRRQKKHRKKFTRAR